MITVIIVAVSAIFTVWCLVRVGARIKVLDCKDE